jgi:hypothetical protein
MGKMDFLLVVIPILIILDAIVDVLFMRGKKFVSKILENIYKSALISLPFIYSNINIEYIIGFLIMYWSFHFSMFDPMFNLTAQLDIDFVGTSSGFYDKILKKLNTNAWILRGFMFVFAIAFYFIAIRKGL